MNLKSVLPVLMVLIVGGAVLSVLWFVQERDEDAIRRLLLDYTRSRMTAEGKVEGRDFTVGSIEILRKNADTALAHVPVKLGAEVEPRFYELRRTNSGWAIECDLVEHFRKAVEQEGFAKGVSERVARTLADRFRMTATVTMEGKPFVFRLERVGADVVSRCRSAFLLERTDGKPDRIEYVEDFRYRSGQWIVEGQGQLLQFRNVR
ncbi:MAG: hypothetical protein HYY17_03850 [Planctomycetes bacterium]|nr:hypothetical protein [Planctomycetota bacterium]